MRGGGVSGNTVKRGNFLQVIWQIIMEVGNNTNYLLTGLDFKKPFLAHFNHISLVPGKRLIHI